MTKGKRMPDGPSETARMVPEYSTCRASLRQPSKNLSLKLPNHSKNLAQIQQLKCGGMTVSGQGDRDLRFGIWHIWPILWAQLRYRCRALGTNSHLQWPCVVVPNGLRVAANKKSYRNSRRDGKICRCAISCDEP
jgi:hypothetical protein